MVAHLSPFRVPHWAMSAAVADWAPGVLCSSPPQIWALLLISWQRDTGAKGLHIAHKWAQNN